MEIMWKQLIKLDRSYQKSLQIQIREQLVTAILNNIIHPEQALPSSRELSKELNVARNTVVLAYDELEAEGYLKAVSRKGYFVEANINLGAVKNNGTKLVANKTPSWCENLLVKRPSDIKNIAKCGDWRKQEFPFIYGQLDPDLIPINDWREAVKQASSVAEIKKWNIDHIDQDDALLVEQIQSKVLPRRGIWAQKDEILVTAGSQNAMYLLTSLLVNEQTSVGIENPCYIDFKNMLFLKTNKLVPIELDQEGIIIDQITNECDLVYTTPSHQYPTGVTMSLERRQQLLEAAKDKNFVIIEDDYEAEINFSSESRPSLKSIDQNSHVIYVGSFSKSFAPGLRMGYIVGPSEFIKEVRSLRRLMQRHLPANNQRAVALFISLGHYHSMLQKIHSAYKERWHEMAIAISKYPDLSFIPLEGGSSFWITVPESIDTRILCKQLLSKGVVIEPGDRFFIQDKIPHHYMRMAYSAIKTEKIARGVQLVAEEIKLLMRS